ncbi:MAG: hypothetical protein QOE19_577 [Actinomycetota bacterium]|nr:hypothetical protein [Actinomycetota bacterium]
MADRLRAGIVGAGFIGQVHARAVRAAGGVVSLVADATPDLAITAAKRLQAERPADSIEELVRSDDVDVVHICVPNSMHVAVAEMALAANKPVICEKPLATTVEDATRLAALAETSQLMTGVPFIYRYYPTVRDARSRVDSGEAGDLRLLHGSYLQDWLSSQRDTDWRVDPAVGGASRAFGDIGVHWCDLLEFTTGHRITRLSAKLVTAYAERDGEGSAKGVGTEDAATVMFETDQGAAGSVVLSQVSPGRKNRLWFSFDGSKESLSFDQENPDSLWIGARSENRTVMRGSTSMSPEAARLSILPAGHPQGYQDCFNAFIGDCYAAVAGEEHEGRPTFEDGRRASVLTQAVLDADATSSWVEVAR